VSQLLSPDGQWWWDGTRWVRVDRGTNPLAIASLGSSLAFLLWPLSSLAAVVLGVIALSQMRPGEGGRGLAIAGIAIGGVVLFLLVLFIVVLVYFGIACRNGC